jgi:hypothetical protein
MNETRVAQVLVGDPLEVAFPRHYTAKAFTTDASRLRDILRLQTRQPLTEAELAEVVELRRKLRRIDGDLAMMEVVRTRLHGGINWF